MPQPYSSKSALVLRLQSYIGKSCQMEDRPEAIIPIREIYGRRRRQWKPG